MDLNPIMKFWKIKYNLGIIGDRPLLAETLSRISGTSKKLPKLNNNLIEPLLIL